MKPLLTAIYTIAALGLPIAVQATQQEPPSAQEQAPKDRVMVNFKILYGYGIDGDTRIRLSFSEPMVRDEQVGKPADNGVYSLKLRQGQKTPQHTATWLSTSELEIEFSEELPVMDIVDLAITDGLKTLHGSAVPSAKLTRPTTHNLNLLYTGSANMARTEVIFLGAEYERDDALVAERIQHAYFTTDNGEKIPANFRPATAADAVQHPAEYRNAFNWRLNDDCEEAMKALPRDAQLPHTWVCDFPKQILSGDETKVLVLPRAQYHEQTETYEDLMVARYEWDIPSYTLSSENTGVDCFRVLMEFSVPSKITDATTLLSRLNLRLQDYKHSDTWLQPEWKDGAWHATVRGVTITLKPDIEETRKHIRRIRLHNGEEQEILNCLVMKAEMVGDANVEVMLECRGNYDNIANKACQEDTSDKTTLKNKTPYVGLDLAQGHLMSTGETAFRCRYANLKNGKIRVLKLEDTPRNVIRTLNMYEKYYSQSAGNLSERNREQLLNNPTDALNKIRVVPTELLVGIEAEAERKLEGVRGETALKVTELFRHQPSRGLYFIEASGEALKNSETPKPTICQGVVQITNLGLLWKCDGKRIFAHGYHLSDGTDVPAATLKLLDIHGKQLAELPLTNGTATGDFPRETTYLMLSTADDQAIFCHASSNFEYRRETSYRDDVLATYGIPESEVPRALIYTFSDRSLYRPGETAHIKGMVRWVDNNEIRTPEIQSITAKLQPNSGSEETYTITPQPDGNFTLDIPAKSPGMYLIRFEIVYKGDDTRTSPDTAVLARYARTEDEWNSLKEALSDVSRNHTHYLKVEEFRRNEFEVSGELNIDLNNRCVTVNTTATNFTTTPVANGAVEWMLDMQSLNFYPQKWQDYYFGDFEENSWDHFYAYYCGNKYAGRSRINTTHRTGTLDEQGKGSCSFSLPNTPPTGRIVYTASSCVTNGNQQRINSVQRETIDHSEVYVGVRTEEGLLKVGTPLDVEYLLVKPDENAWDGAAQRGHIEVIRTNHYSYRYGADAASSVQNIQNNEIVFESDLSLTGTPGKVQVPLKHAGKYTIRVSGTDSKGMPYATTITRYVWGENESPWYYEANTGLNLVEDKALYKAGDTAHILVQTPVDAELMVTVERGTVLRSYRLTVTVANPVIEVPIEATDAPVVYVNVALVQSGKNRAKNGMPLLKRGSCCLRVEKADKVLNVQLTPPQKHLLPTDECTVSGTVRDAAGNPVANADVTLYAEDEGTLQVCGYTLPRPQLLFYSQEGRACTVPTFSGLGELIEDKLQGRDFGNKGIFIGGGDAESSFDDPVTDDEAEKLRLRENFSPCALWLGSVRTDAQGNFSATYRNPDTLTRYRVMAVASTQDEFGSEQAAYHVTKPIMLEATVPNGAAEGDLLHLPVTLSMLPDELPEAANGAEVQWKVSISGTNVELPEAEQLVTLKGNAPVTIHFPVRVLNSGKAELVWRVQAADAQATGTLARCGDGVKLAFNVIPPTPFVGERIFKRLENGQRVTLQQLLRTQYRAGSPVELNFSTSPLAGLKQPLKYLITYPYGCSEQRSSALIPWLIRDELQDILRVEYPNDKTTQQVVDTTLDILEKRSTAGGFAYWDGDTEACSYTPYVVLVLQLAMEKGFTHSLFETSTLNALYENLKQRAMPQESKRPNRVGGLLAANSKPATRPDLLSLYVLARAGKLRQYYIDNVESMFKRLGGATPNEQWMLALCARVVNHPRAAEMKQAAEAAPRKNKQLYTHYILPPQDCIRLMYAIADSAESPATAEMLRNMLDTRHRYYSSWNNGWMVLAIHEYIKAVQLQDLRARINGQDISLQSPMVVNTVTDNAQAYAVEDGAVYICGYAEGHLQQEQPVKMIDEGILVTRRYEKRMPDGSWQPTSTFELGDIVRIHISAKPGNKMTADNLTYLALEDRLPATMEAINPALTSQALPDGLEEKDTRDWWYYCSAVSNREYLKDRVRFFANSLSFTGELKASYVARVVRKGSVTAPAAKAELMYRPEIRGLSIPSKIEVK